MLQGNLEFISIPNLLQLFVHEKKTGVLCLSDNGKDLGKVFFKNGNIIAAVFGNLRGKEALFRLVNLKNGEFVFKKEEALPAVEINEPYEVLLLEALRKEDENKHLEEEFLNRFKSEVSKVERVEWRDFLSAFKSLGILLDLGEVEYILLKDNKHSSLVFQIRGKIFKFDLYPGLMPEEVARKIKEAF